MQFAAGGTEERCTGYVPIGGDEEACRRVPFCLPVTQSSDEDRHLIAVIGGRSEGRGQHVTVVAPCETGHVMASPIGQRHWF